jgi:hypothetical protein
MIMIPSDEPIMIRVFFGCCRALFIMLRESACRVSGQYAPEEDEQQQVICHYRSESQTQCYQEISMKVPARYRRV